jgi:hypothetical protein
LGFSHPANIAARQRPFRPRGDSSRTPSGADTASQRENRNNSGCGSTVSNPGAKAPLLGDRVGASL